MKNSSHFLNPSKIRIFSSALFLSSICCISFRFQFQNPRLKRRIGLFCRVKSLKSIRSRSNASMRLILIIASLYCLWCASQIYLVNPRRAPVGEEADLGVLVFLGIYLCLPHGLCIMSMNPKEYAGSEEQLPL